jgi:hypothetical protein
MEGAGAAVRVPVFGASSSCFYPPDNCVLWESFMVTHSFESALVNKARMIHDKNPSGDKKLKPTSLLYANICENSQLRHLTHLQGKFMVCPWYFPYSRADCKVPNLHSSSFIKEDTQHWEDEFLHPAPPPLNLCSNMRRRSSREVLMGLYIVYSGQNDEMK